MKLSECVFSDIYVSTSPTSPPVVRSLEYRDENGEWRIFSGVVPAPKNVWPDVRELFERVLAEAKEKRNDELAVKYDGVIYRCANIVAPEGVTPRRAAEVQNWCIRRIRSEVLPFADLSLEPKIKRILNNYQDKRGLVIVCGSFGSGKTTTASSLFDHWVTKTCEVGVTLEDPPEVSLARVSDTGTIYQVDLTEKSPEEAIKKLRRWAPRYVFLGEVRTAEAAQELLQISQSGPLVMATVHASDPVSAITALMRFASARMSENDARDLIARTVQGIVYLSYEKRKFKSRFLSIGEKEDVGIRTKIRRGDFQRIDEAMEWQEQNR